MSALTPKYSCAPPGAKRKPTNTSSKISTMPRSVQTSRSCFNHCVYAARSKCALRPLSSSDESPGAPLFGCSACKGLTSTQAMSQRVRSTFSERSAMSVSV